MAIVESSTNLTDWGVVSVPVNSESVEFLAPPGDSHRYFRLISPP